MGETKAQSELEAVHLEHVYSCEYYLHQDGSYDQVLKDINFIVHPGEVWEVAGISAFEQRLLLEIIANAKPYQKGRCILNERGMMRRKSTILPHVFYIGGSNMLLDGFTTIGYLLFLTARQSAQEDVRLLQMAGVPPTEVVLPVDDRSRELALRRCLTSWGLHYLEDTLIDSMTASQRSILTLAVAVLGHSNIIIWNLPRMVYDEREVSAIRRICSLLAVQERTLVLASQDYRMTQTIATHVLLLHNGLQVACGPIGEFVECWDNSVIDVEDPDTERIREVLERRVPNLRCHADYAGVLRISTRGQCDRTDLSVYDDVYGALLAEGIYPAVVRRVGGLLSRAVQRALEVQQ